MKNKEIESVLNELKINVNKHFENPLKYTKEYKDYVLLSYIEQLENNRDKAIEYINENWGHWCSNHYKYATETIDILKGGSD